MTTINLLTALEERISEITKNYKFRVPKGDEYRAPKVWKQHLPENLYEDEPNPGDYPLALIVASETQIDESGDRTAQVTILVGGYDNGQAIEGGVRDRQGWMLPAEMMDRILFDFVQNPRVGDMFDIKFPVSTELPDDQPAPLWYGAIYTTWSMPMPPQGFLMDYWPPSSTVGVDPYPA